MDNVDEIYLRGDQATFMYSLKNDTIVYESVFPPGKVTAMPPENVRFRVVIKGVAENAADVTAFIKRLEQSDYLCQIIPVTLQNIKGTFAAEFEINCYVANFILE